MLRQDVESAIRRWTRLGLSQKELAHRAGASETTLSHVINDPGYTIGEGLSRRIIRVVDLEDAKRIAMVPMEIITFCHGPDFVDTEEKRLMILSTVRSALENGAFDDGACDLPEHVKGVLIRLGGPRSPFFLIALGTTNSEEERVALAHELDHVRKIILDGIAQPQRAPRSLF